MSKNFIWLTQIAVGCIAVRYSEISYMETLCSGATKVHLSLGIPIIVEESQSHILKLIRLREDDAA
jgi:hypothetical protein